MNKVVVYIHGKGGNISEANHYKPLFKGYDVVGLDYASNNPWQAKIEFEEFFKKIKEEYEEIRVIANSIGAYFLLNCKDIVIDKAYFISPVVDMEKLIYDMMLWNNVSLQQLEEFKEIKTSFNETLSWQYLCWVKENPVEWKIDTCILYGSKDNMQSMETIKKFVDKTSAQLTVLEDGQHWFHEPKQMEFLDHWIMSNL